MLNKENKNKKNLSLKKKKIEKYIMPAFGKNQKQKERKKFKKYKSEY